MHNKNVIHQSAVPVEHSSKPGTFPIFWFKHSNFGDNLPKYMLERLFPEQVFEYSTQAGKLVSVGSVVCNSLLKNGDAVWGAGLIAANAKPASNGLNVLSLRGPLTRQRMIACGYEKNIPEVFGDPAILLPKIYPVQSEKKYELGVIPHYIDYRMFLKVRKDFVSKDILIIDILKPIEDILNDMNSCNRIMTSSLHGLIVSETYGIPCLFVKMSENVFGGTFKFEDYYRSTNRQLSYYNLKDITVAKALSLPTTPAIIDMKPMLERLLEYMASKNVDVTIAQKLL